MKCCGKQCLNQQKIKHNTYSGVKWHYMEILWFTNWSRNSGCSQTDFRLARSHLIAMYGNPIWHPLSNIPKEFISIPHVVVEILLKQLFIHATYTLITTWWSPNYLAILRIPSHEPVGSFTICQVAWWDGSHRWTNRWRRLSSVPGRQGSRSPKCWRATGDRPGGFGESDRFGRHGNPCGEAYLDDGTYNLT